MGGTVRYLDKFVIHWIPVNSVYMPGDKQRQAVSHRPLFPVHSNAISTSVKMYTMLFS